MNKHYELLREETIKETTFDGDVFIVKTFYYIDHCKRYSTLEKYFNDYVTSKYDTEAAYNMLKAFQNCVINGIGISGKVEVRIIERNNYYEIWCKYYMTKVGRTKKPKQ